VRVVIAMENVTRVRLFFVPLFEPGALQSVEFVERLSPGVWGLYLLTRTAPGASARALGHEASYVNRAAAMYRHLLGIPTDQEPPMAQ
jgi:hypothetical protein